MIVNVNVVKNVINVMAMDIIQRRSLMDKILDKLPYYISVVQLVATIILIINHASRDLMWKPLLILLIPMLAMYFGEQRRINRK